MTPTRKSWREDERGVAAIEFAIIAPIMILIYFALAELTGAMIANGRAAHVAAVVGDLVTQQSTSITEDQLEDIFKVGDSIMQPFPTASLGLRITSVRADDKGVPQIIWSDQNNMSQLKPGKAAGFPSGLLVAGESVIMSDVQYTYTSPIQQIIPTPLTFSTRYYVKPRRSSEVALVH